METNTARAVVAYNDTSVNSTNIFGVLQSNLLAKQLLFVVIVLTIVEPMKLSDYFERACTGTLIRDDLVLTLASCLLMEYYDNPHPDNIKVYERTSAKPLHALKIIVNPNYYSDNQALSLAYDFAVIVVEKSRQKIYPAIPQKEENLMEIKDTCMMGGYGNMGKVSMFNFALINLNDTELEIYKGHWCSTTSILCLHFGRMMPCLADIGTPIICHGDFYAMYVPMVSRLSVACDSMFITTFLPVFKIKVWLEEIIDAPASSLEWLNNPWYILLLCICVFVIMGAIYYSIMEFLEWYADFTNEIETSVSDSLEEKENDDVVSYENIFHIK